MDWIGIENAIRGLIKAETGLEAVWGSSNGVQVTRPYVVLQWLSIEQLGDAGFTETYNEDDDTVESNYYASRKAQVDVQVIAAETRASGNALAYLDRLVTAFDLQAPNKQWLDPVDVAVADFTPVRLLDAVEDDGRIVSRAGFTLKLNMAANAAAAESAGAISAVALTGTLSGAVTGSITDDMIVTR